MSDNRDHVVDELVAHMFRSLDDTERARVETHVASCESCASRLIEYETVLDILPLALPPVAPPPNAWEAIHSSVALQRRHTPVARRAAVRGRWFRIAAWSGVAAATALLTWNLILQDELARYRHGPQVEKLARRPARLVILSGPADTNASARIFAAIDGHSGHMAVTGLPRATAGRVYQLWFMPSAGPPATAATFNVDRDGRAWVVITVPAPLDETRAIVVTEEPAPGSAVPRGPILLEASRWR